MVNQVLWKSMKKTLIWKKDAEDKSGFEESGS